MRKMPLPDYRLRIAAIWCRRILQMDRLPDSTNAEKSNAENLLIIHDRPDLYAAYEANMRIHFEHRDQYGGHHQISKQSKFSTNRHRFDIKTSMNPSDIDQLYEILIRLCSATIAGAIMGINRDLHRKPAGLRVLAMVSLGACAITMASITAAASISVPPNDGVSKTIQGILSGIGFLGAGVIMRLQGKDEVHGIIDLVKCNHWNDLCVGGMVVGYGNFWHRLDRTRFRKLARITYHSNGGCETKQF